MENLKKEMIEEKELKIVEAGASGVGTSHIIEQHIGNVSDVPKIKLTDGVQKILDTLGNLNYIELETLKNKMNGEKENINSANQLLEAIEKMNTDPMNKKIMSENVLDTLDVETFNKDSEKFKADFITMTAEIDMIISKIDEEISTRYNDVSKTTSFLSGQLIESLDKTLDTNKNADPFNLKRLEKTKYIYENRTDLEFIFRKAELEAKRHNVQKGVKKDATKAVKKAVKSLSKFFSKDQLITVEKFIWEQFNKDRQATTNFLVHMSNLIVSEERQVNHNWIVVLFMNIIDIENNLFDLGDKEDYITKLKELYEFYK